MSALHLVTGGDEPRRRVLVADLGFAKSIDEASGFTASADILSRSAFTSTR